MPLYSKHTHTLSIHYYKLYTIVSEYVYINDRNRLASASYCVREEEENK